MTHTPVNPQLSTRNPQQLWAETFRYAKERSPFYREWLAGFETVPPLDQVPTVDKATVSARNLDFLCVPREQIVEIVTTSGTTGQPLVWMLTENDVRRLARNERESFQCAGLTAQDTVLVAVAMDRCFIAGLAYWLGLRELGCAVARAGATSPLLVLELIERVRPTAIVGVPSFLRLLADKARETGFDLAGCPVTKAICIGEPVRGWERGLNPQPSTLNPQRALGLNAAGRAIEAAWGARVYSTYGVTELANSLCECDAGAGGHLHADQLHLEVLDDDGRPVPDGEAGEVVATTFGVEAMPLIRSRTGDCAALFRAPCACGRTTPRLGPIVGRKHHKLKVRGVSLFPSTLEAVIEEAEGIEAFVILARKESELSDSVEVLVELNAEPGTRNAEQRLDALREALQARARITPQVRQAPRAEIQALQLPPQARKRRTFVDLRCAPQSAL